MGDGATPSGPSLGGHGVQFYGYDAQLIGRVARYVAPALRDGGAAVVVATQRHRDDVRSELEARGIDVAGAERVGRYAPFDAAELLSRITVDGSPDRGAFTSVVGGAIGRASGPARRHVRVYGEMVSLLWLAGRPDAAMRLERMWNALTTDVPFTLLCGYPLTIFLEPAMAAAAAEIASAHTHVVRDPFARAEPGPDGGERVFSPAPRRG